MTKVDIETPCDMPAVRPLIRMLEIQTEADVTDFFRKNMASYRAETGVLTFLYSLIQTKVSGQDVGEICHASYATYEDRD